MSDAPVSQLFQLCLAVILANEGGFVNNEDDPGGATNYGITRATLQTWRAYPISVEDVRALTREEAGSIYHADYWLPICGDQLPAMIALTTFDSAVNCGVNRASHWLQAAVGAAQDGIVGPRTLAATRATVAAHTAEDVAAEVLAQRIVYHASLPTWRVFGNGWARRLARLGFQAGGLG